MPDIREWLEDLGLGQYADAFEAEQFDLEAAAYLDDHALKALGIPMGPRLKLLAAVAALKAGSAYADSFETKATEVVRDREAERRQITVMFCDLVGSTALSEQLDPEDLRTLMQAYQQACGAEIQRYEGHVAQYLGDGLMTYFGWPQAHEDDAERAVRAALDIVYVVKEVPAPRDLQVRIGIATGPVVVGETGAGDPSVAKLAVGETPNLAARLQGLADADTIVVGSSTQRLLGHTFELDDLGPQSLKGIIEPVEAYKVVGVARTEGRFAARTMELTPLFGRDAEMAMMNERWRQARAGEGQVVALSGEPGIGKSRIAQTLVDQLSDEPHSRLRYQCSPYHANSALFPIIEQIEHVAGFHQGDGPEDRLNKLEAIVPERTEPNVCALFASLLSLPTERYPPLEMSPQKQKEETLGMLSGQVISLARSQPTLLIFEDVHWIDPTSQELLDLIIPLLGSHQILAVITHRPEYQPPWLGQGHVTSLSLKRLGRTDAAEMVSAVSEMPMSAEMLQEIVARTDGVPLFVEELTKSVGESEAGVSDAIPETLQDSLMARLDRLGPAKQVAQVGACIGRVFDLRLVAKVCSLNESEFNEAIEQLVGSGLVHRASNGYLFKHALIQDAAYRSLLTVRRSALHEDISKALRADSPKIVEDQPEIIANHLTEAGRTHEAIHFWLRAVKKSASRHSHQESISHFERGLELLSGEEPSIDRDETELGLWSAIGPVFITALGYGDPKTVECYEKAYVLWKGLGDPTKHPETMYGYAAIRYVRGDISLAIRIVEQFLEMEVSETESNNVIVLKRLHGTLLCQSADYEGALNRFAETIRLSHEARDRSINSQYGHSPRSIALSFQGLAKWIVGYADEGSRIAETGIEWSREIDNPHMLTFALYMAVLVDLLRNDLERVRRNIEPADNLCHKIGNPIWVGYSNVLQGTLMARSGDPGTGAALIRTGIDTLERVNCNTMVPAFRAFEAEALIANSEPEIAGVALRVALDQIARTDEAWAEPECWRLMGQVEVARGDCDEAEKNYQKAIEIAGETGAKSFELRAVTELAGLWHQHDRHADAIEILESRLRWFTEGFDTTDLIEAKALLGMLEHPAAPPDGPR